MEVRLPDGSVREYEAGVMLMDVAKSISDGLARKATGAVVDGKLMGLQETLDGDAEVRFVTLDDPEGKEVYWHTASHVMAAAIQHLYPGTQFAIGPAISTGYYYDLDTPHRFQQEDFEAIEKEMQRIAKEAPRLEREVLSRQEARDMFEKMGQKYKVELIDDLPEDETISVYRLGDFVDLCRGPHLFDAKRVKHSKLLSIAGAYWRGDEKNQMLQRLYAVSYEKQKDLQAHLDRIEDAKARDHRKIGKELDLFMLSPDVGAGLPFWLPKGATIRRIIERYIVDKEIEVGYNHVYTPIMAKVDLYKTSGHWDHYHDSMFPPMDMGDGEMLVLRPMNCPHHMEIYKNDVHSYREFPIRIAELGMMHRYEKSGELSGLQRVREMVLNDAHIFVRPDQIKDEFKRVMDLMLAVYEDFDIKDYEFRLSYRDPENKEKYFDDDKMWNNSQRMLKEVMDEMGLEYFEAVGEAAFYGPKLDVQVKTAIGMEETLSTIQLDFLLPERFDLTYVGEDGQNDHRPVVIHRGIVSTMERFVAYLIEEYKGAFPVWLAPVQATLIPVNVGIHGEGVKKHVDQLKKMGLRIDFDDRNEKMGRKIAESQVQKIPYQLVFGDKEIEEDTVTVRRYGETETETMAWSEFVQRIDDENRNRLQTSSKN